MRTLHVLLISIAVASVAVCSATAAKQAIPLSEFVAIKRVSGGFWRYKWERDDLYARSADGRLEYLGTVESRSRPRGLAWLGDSTGLISVSMTISKDGRAIVFRHWPLYAPKPGSRMPGGIYQYVHGEELKVLVNADELAGQSYTRWDKPFPTDVLPFEYRDTHTRVGMVWAVTASGEYFPLALYEGGPLHWASFEGRTEDCVRLRNEGANLDAATYWGFTPLDLAIIRNHEGTAIRLFELGARAGEDDLPPLFRAAMLGRLELVRALLDRGANPNARDKHGNTALHAAAFVAAQGSGEPWLFFDRESPRSLLDRKVTVPLIKLLMDRGADPTIRNERGETPLAALHPYAPEEARALLGQVAKP